MPTLEILAIVLFAIANGVFAMSEISVVSARRARLEALAKEGDRKARIALDLANNPNDFLSTVQIGITLIGTLSGAFGGATLAAYLTAPLNGVSWIAPHGDAVALGIVVVAISYLSLVVGELVPKRIGLSNPERFASALGPAMHLLSRVASPAVRFLSWSTDVVVRLIPMRHETQQTVTEEEVRHMLDQATQTGTFEQAEQEMVEGVFRLADRRVVELMTPRHEITWIDPADSHEQIRETLRLSSHTRFPVADGDLDRLLGFIHVKHLLDELLAGQPFEIKPLIRKAPVVPESMRALKALDVLKTSKSYLAFIVNEHGGVEGLVTLSDLFEAVIGDVPAAESPSQASHAVQREDGSWLIDGMMPAYQFKELLEIRALPGEGQGTFTTLGGFIMSALGQVPKVTDHIKHSGWRLEVMDMDGSRVDKVLVSPLAASVDVETPDAGS